MAEKQNQDLSENSELTSSRFFRQTALDRRRPSGNYLLPVLVWMD
ncbi:hypothetical protein P5673_019897 [Acropora cervicornis]|uniref:Uncharacterized protein n=1 Tax=Acropora cervicornis TaxID=6130 RepID=A0AAD9V1M2_ACRCE|nr:hypothetical protein P5673_019897 [Acropora cervicornis]